MARGFWKGLLHGAVIGGICLAGLSLIAPLPELSPEQSVVPPPVKVGNTAHDPMQQPPQSTTTAEPTPKAADQPAAQPAVVATESAVPLTTAKPAVSAEPVAEDKPKAAEETLQAVVIDMPTGSEFGRGNDTLLERPASFAPSGQPGPPEPPLLSPPSTDSVLLPATANRQRPRAILDGQNMAKPIGNVGKNTPEFTRPTGWNAPDEIGLPAMANTGIQDGLPVSEPVQAVARGEADIAAKDIPQIIAPQISETTPSVPIPASDDTTPDLQRPAFDLSTPPDLGALQRN